MVARSSSRSSRPPPVKTRTKIWKDLQATGGECITYGSFFSGMENSLLAFKFAMKAQFGTHAMQRLKHLFAIDNNPHCRAFLRANVGSECIIHGEVKDVPMKKLPRVEVLWYSPPCQGYSLAGNMAGWEESGQYKDGSLVEYPLQYIKKHRPTVAIMEQVATLKTRFPEVFDYIIQSLEGIGARFYQVKADTLNTRDFGIPHQRRRVYIVAIAKHAMTQEFEMPPPIRSNVVLKNFLDMRTRGNFSDQPDWIIKNIICCYARIIQQGGDPFQQTWIADVRASQRWKPQIVNTHCPTITASRAMQGGFWVTNLMRFLTAKEMAAFQGLDMLNDVVMPAGLTIPQFNKMVGNSVSVNVAMLVFDQVLHTNCVGR